MDSSAAVWFDSAWLQANVLALTQTLQLALLWVWHALGGAGDAHGQAAWPFAHRVATETLAIDRGLVRDVAAAAVLSVCAAATAVAALVWRRHRWTCAALAVTVLAWTPWPAASLLLTDAVPTSFHRSPTAFDAASIERGVTLFEAQCAQCHGADGAGDGPRAASLPMWPPRLDGELLWRRLDGEVFWHIQQGLQDRHGRRTMPGYADRLSDGDVWALIDAMKALAAGASVRTQGVWSQPVRVPQVTVRCDDALATRSIDSWHGQRVRIVAAGAAVPAAREDPRLVTIALRAPGSAGDGQAGCVVDSPEAYAAFARIAGTDAPHFVGAQILIDRDGWVRAFGRPGAQVWSQADLLCRASGRAAPAASVAPSADPLGDLIAAIDASPIVSRGQGLAHGL